MANVSNKNGKIEKDFSPMVEGLMAYCFKHKLVDNLVTTDGKDIQIHDPGLFNRNYGPDFFNAKLRINNTLWVGNILVLPRSSEWNERGYRKVSDDFFRSIILTIVAEMDCEITNLKGDTIPQCVYTVPDNIRNNYNLLISKDGCNACQNYRNESMTKLASHAWMAAIETEWLENATDNIYKQAISSSWQDALTSAITGSTVITHLSENFKRNILKAESGDQVRQIIKDFLGMMNKPKGNSSVENALVNIVLPWLFAYGRYHNQESACEKAFYIMDDTRPYATETFVWPTIEKLSGAEISAVRFLKKQYCAKKRCCNCRFGHEFLRHNKASHNNLQLSLIF